MKAWRGLLAALLAWPAAVSAQSPTFDSTWTVGLHAHGDNGNELDDDDDYGDVLSIYDLKSRWGDHTFSLRVDALRFVAPPSGDVIRDTGTADYADEYTIEKLGWSWRSGPMRVGVGDQYVSFGRGLSLSLRKIDDLGIDTTLRGARLRWKGKLLRVEGIGGWTNASNLDPINERLRFASCTPTFEGDEFSCNPLRIDPADFIGGVRVESRYPRFLHLGVSEVAMRRWDEEHTTWVHGASLSLAKLPLDGAVYVEAAWMDRSEFGLEDGSGVYGSIDLDLWGWSLTLEGKRYDNFILQTKLPPDKSHFSTDRTFVYNEPPSLELLEEIPYDNVNSTGGRVRLGHRFEDTGTRITVTAAGFATGLDASRRTIEHGAVTMEQDLPSRAHLTLEGGRRLDLPEGRGGLERRLWHTEGKLVVPVHGPHSGSLGWSMLFWDTVATGDERSYTQGDAYVGYSWAPRFSATLIFGIDDELTEKINPRLLKREQDKHRQGLPADPANAIQPVRTKFFAAQATWYPAQWLIVQGLVGSLRGGPKCIGSVCRIYPPFSGAKADITMRF